MGVENRVVSIEGVQVETRPEADHSVLRSWRERVLLKKITLLKVALLVLLAAVVAAVTVAVVFATDDGGDGSNDGEYAEYGENFANCDLDDFNLEYISVTSAQISTAEASSCPELPANVAPSGYAMKIVTCNLFKPRSISVGKQQGVYFLGSRFFQGNSSVVAVHDHFNGTVTKYELDSLDQPHGVQYNPKDGGTLFVTDALNIYIYKGVDAVVEGTNSELKKITIRDVFPSLPSLEWHHIRQDVGGNLVVSTSAGCDHCVPVDGAASISLVNASNCYSVKLLYQGVRFSVGFDFHPADESLWFTNNAHDSVDGDDSHDTLNKGSYSEEHFGFPFCFYNGSSFTDTSNDDISFEGSLSYSNASTGMVMDCSTLKTQTVSLGSHAAPLGMRFCSAQLNSNFSSSDCQDRIYVAERKDYQIGVAQLDGNSDVVGYETFISGFDNGGGFGGFVDVAFDADGSMLVTDDFSSMLYRIYKE